MTPTAYLRVYQPAESFTEGERSAWLTQSTEDEDGELPRQHGWFISSALPPGDARRKTADGCFVRRIDGKVYLCPWRTRLRVLAGLLAFRGSVPEEVADAFVSRAEAERAARELASLERSNPDIRSHILHANWHVPLRWFAAFDASERVLVEDKRGLRIRYETDLDRARQRLRRANEGRDEGPIDQTVADAIQELRDWLEEFTGDGLVELDYGGVALTIHDDDLVEDQSAAEVWVCLDALEARDIERAAEVFERLSDRWTQVRAMEVVN